MYQRTFNQTAKQFKSNLIVEAELKVWFLTKELNQAISDESYTTGTPISLPYDRVKKLQNELREAYFYLTHYQNL